MSRNLILQVLYEFLRNEMRGFPAWVRARAGMFQERYGMEHAVMETLLKGTVDIDPYVREVQFEWLGRSLLIQARVAQESTDESGKAASAALPQRIRETDAISRNALRDMVAEFVRVSIDAMPRWLSLQSDYLGSTLKVQPVKLQMLSFQPLTAKDTERLVYEWADRVIRLNVSVLNED